MKVQPVSRQSAMVSLETSFGEEASVPSEASIQDSTFSAAPAPGLPPLRLTSNQWKNQVRSRVESRLHDVFKVPHLIDGLTDFLCEALSEDPVSRKLFGI